ncbi:unnamed protein product [Brachionus calyciflorus]|uniref:Uncharacterized protein n=1 Tax=Brachionus calyciflorus TaxID=104777 RepID=A0A813M352_9BILA|nr:unnamed protein product [Brachionus calyciflorus]
MTIIQRKQQRPSKKITYLLKECQSEMNDMKCELFDLQTALNACRTSLKNLHLSPNSLYSRDLSVENRSIDFAPCLNSTARKIKKIKTKKTYRQSHRTRSRITDSESVFTSSSSSLVESSTYTYPSTSSYSVSNQYPVQFKSVKISKNSNHRNFGYQIVSKKTTTLTTDEYSAKFNSCQSCRSSKFQNLGFNLTPVKCNVHSCRSKKRQKYDFNTIFYPYKKDDKINCLNGNTLSSISSPTRFSEKLSQSSTNSLKDQFLVINHKNELSGNQTIFEPKASSTPKKVYHKTSTPKIDNSYFENILIDLEANSRKLASLFKSKDSNKISDYFSSSTQIEDNEYDLPGPRTNENHEYQSPNAFNVNNKEITLIEEKKDEDEQEEEEEEEEENLKLSTPVKSFKIDYLDESNKNNESENLTRISSLESKKSRKVEFNEHRESLIYSEDRTFKNISLVSTASSVRSTVIKCCIKPFKLLYNSKNLKKKF